MNQTASTNKARLLIDHPHSYREWRIQREEILRLRGFCITPRKGSIQDLRRACRDNDSILSFL